MGNKKNFKIFLAGHNGLVGSAILKKLKKKNFKEIIIANKKELDLRDQKKVFTFFKKKTNPCYYSGSQGWRYKS